MARAALDALPGYESRSSNTGGGRNRALRSDEGGPLFSDLVASSPRHRRRRLGLGVSSGVHALLAGILLLAPILWPTPPPGHRDYVRALLYDPPRPPPLPLPRGSALAPQAKRPQPVTPAPSPRAPALTAPVETPRTPEELKPEAGAPESEQWGSATGSDAGVPEGMEGGVEGGMVGGVPGGVLGGVIGGTGDIPLTVEYDYDRPPRILRQTKPVYPQEAFVQKVEGIVVVEILIDPDGRVVRARVVRSVPLLDAAALEAVRQWTFAPAIKRGRAVATVAEAPITFSIY